jgi:hypothetical protein
MKKSALLLLLGPEILHEYAEPGAARFSRAYLVPNALKN